MTQGFGETPAPVPHWVAAACVAAMLALAGSFWKDALGRPSRDEIAELRPAFYDTAAVRKVRKDMTFDGTPCQSCHDGKEPMQGNPHEKGVFHEGIELRHGRNQHCFNCHSRLQPADFSNFDGSKIAIGDVQLLCARCHGTHYRDWELGSHGRRMGAWDPSKGGPKPTVCIACHDPHWPVFKPLNAAPAPHVNPRAVERHG